MNGFIYCRSHFFKSCLFKGNLQQYFQDYYKDEYENAYIDDGIDLFGRKMKVSDIKVIVTDNSLKWLKFTEYMSRSGSVENGFRYYKSFMERDGENFQIVKTAHASKYGDVQRSSFQMNNTLLTLDREKLKSIFIICSVLAQCSIDSAKRNFDVTVAEELTRLQGLACMNPGSKYPRFYAELQKLKDKHKKGKKKNIDDKDVRFYDCPMDILYQIIGEEIVDMRTRGCRKVKTVRDQQVQRLLL